MGGDQRIFIGSTVLSLLKVTNNYPLSGEKEERKTLQTLADTEQHNLLSIFIEY